MATTSRNIIVLAGPNGAGKSTTAPALLQGTLGVTEFANADTIARGLSAFDPERAAFAAGRIMLGRLRELAAQRVDFAFETTLASRSFAPWISELVRSGYKFRLLFLWLPSPDAAIARVAGRIKDGGHSVPEVTIRRRYKAGLRNFLSLYRPMSTDWRVYDNSGIGPPRLIAAGSRSKERLVRQPRLWKQVLEGSSS